jgi:signal transduction histidine kinase
MAPRNEVGPPQAGGNAHRQARLLRHEVGDLLQSVYSTVGVLLERLPGDLTLERRLVSDLKTRAEWCKVELDAVVELVSPLPLTPSRLDLLATVQSVLTPVRRRFPGLQIHFDALGPAGVEADPRALSSSLGLLFLAVCQGAQRQVLVRVGREGSRAECSLQRDGYSATPEQLAWLNQPFATTQHAMFGLGLALAQRVVQGAGGEVTAANRQEGGVGVRILLPAAEDV